MSSPELVESVDWNSLIKRLEAAEAAAMPTNAIIPWYGNEADVPDGWTICDGRARPAGSSPANTPDLSASFIKGASVDGEVGNTGGSASHSHEAPVSRTGGDAGVPNSANAPWGYAGGPSKLINVFWADTTGTYSNWMRTSTKNHEPTHMRMYLIMKD